MSDAPTASSAPQGWYDDPSNNMGLRWWNGDTWTEHLAPKRPTLAEDSNTLPNPLTGLSKKLRKATEAVLARDEDVRGAWRTGIGFGEALVCTDRRVIVIKRDADLDRQVNSYPYLHIGSVHLTGGSSLKNPFTSSRTELQLSVPGVQAQTSTDFGFDWTGRGRQRGDRLFAANAVTFGPSNAQRAAAAEAANLIRQLVEHARVAKTATATNEKACPRCAETIKAAAIVCRFCGNHL